MSFSLNYNMGLVAVQALLVQLFDIQGWQKTCINLYIK